MINRLEMGCGDTILLVSLQLHNEGGIEMR